MKRKLSTLSEANNLRGKRLILLSRHFPRVTGWIRSVKVNQYENSYAYFTTEDDREFHIPLHRYNQVEVYELNYDPEWEDYRDYLAEAFRMINNETMMIPQREHLIALYSYKAQQLELQHAA